MSDLFGCLHVDWRGAPKGSGCCSVSPTSLSRLDEEEEADCGTLRSWPAEQPLGADLSPSPLPTAPGDTPETAVEELPAPEASELGAAQAPAPAEEAAATADAGARASAARPTPLDMGADGARAQGDIEARHSLSSSESHQRQRSPSKYLIDDYREELDRGVSAELVGLNSIQAAEEASDAGRGGCCPCCPPLLDSYLTVTEAESSAHRRLSLLASIPLDENNPEHRRGMEQYWHLMLGKDVPYEKRSPKWSDDLGFQSPSPWTDFRGGGLLALRCLLFMADEHNDIAQRLAEEARYAKSRSWYPFSPAGITICQMLAVHLRLHAAPTIGPIREQPQAHALALKRFVRDLATGDPVDVFANYWLTAFMKLHREWLDLCAKDPRANVLVSFKLVYRNVGVALERALGSRRKDRLKLLANVNTQSKVTTVQNRVSRSESRILTGALAFQRCSGFYRPPRRRSSHRLSATLREVDNDSSTETAAIMGPPESIKAPEIYQLYRGTAGSVEGYLGLCHVWVDFPSMQLALAQYDLPASAHTRVSLFDITWCRCERVTRSDSALFQVDIFSSRSHVILGLREPEPTERPNISVAGSSECLKEWSQNLQKLLESRDNEGRGGLLFIQRRLFQYLWRSQVLFVSEEKLYEAQAVLAFNLEPKAGVAYLKRKLHKSSDDEVGEWLSQVCNERGGLDPTMLGAYFSRKDTLPVFWSFVRRIDFGGLDIVHALRQLFDTFKPGGEGQVITRILEHFAESYFQHWQEHKDSITPLTHYKTADSVEQIAVSLIMLNTGLHVVTKKVTKNRPPPAAMTVEEYIDNTRRCVCAEEVPDEALRAWYDDVNGLEISVEPTPRVPFSKLPVQPDVEGWLIAVFSPQAQLRYWAVLALQRLYLFTDSNGEDPEDAIDLKEVGVQPVIEDPAALRRFRADLQGSGGRGCFSRRGDKNSTEFVAELLAAEDRALEISAKQPIQLQSCAQPRSRLVFVAESRDLTEKWVNLISCG